MVTNLILDDQLIILAQKVGHHKTKKEAVTVALKEYISYKKQQEVMQFLGTIKFDTRYDYKKIRNR